MPSDQEMLFTASRNGDVKTVRVLLESMPDLVHAMDDQGNTGLHHAALAGFRPRPSHVEVAEILLNHGAEVNQPGFEGNLGKATALIMASFASPDNLPTVKVLLQYGADPNAVSSEGQTALQSAAEHGAYSICNVLLANEARFTSHVSACLGNAQRMDTMVKANPARVHERDNYHRATPLYFAALRNRIEIAELLVRYGAEIEVTDHRGNTPLHVAAAAPGTEVVDFLLKRGAKTDVRNQDEQTPLHRAIDEWWGEASEVIKLLIRAGADPESVDVKGETPLQYAQKRNKHHLVIKLRQFGAKV